MFLFIEELSRLLNHPGNDKRKGQANKKGAETEYIYDRSEAGETPALQPFDNRVEEVGEDPGHCEGNQDRLQISEDVAKEKDKPDCEDPDHDECDPGEGTPEGAALKVGWELAGQRSEKALS